MDPLIFIYSFVVFLVISVVIRSWYMIICTRLTQVQDCSNNNVSACFSEPDIEEVKKVVLTFALQMHLSFFAGQYGVKPNPQV